MNRIDFSWPHGLEGVLTTSWDDGTSHDRRLVEIFNRYGIRGTFHLNSGNFDSGHLKSSEIKELYIGHEVSAHSLNHPFLTLLPREALVEEITEDRRRLEKLVGYPVRGMSYPFGDYNEELLKALPGLGIEYSRTTQEHGRFSVPGNFLTWHPTCHHEQNLLEKCRQFKNRNPWDQLPLFYVWGHSFEFHRNNNWELIEEFCKVVSGDEDVWYATNVEIMDYILAMRNLKFGVDRNFVMNPSAISVWIDVDGEAVEIKPGEQLQLSA